jgi:hypothetical protein
MSHTHTKKHHKNIYFLIILFFGTIIIPFTLSQALQHQTSQQYAQFVPNTQFSLKVFLHGIGNSGDATNPNTHSLSQKSPVYRQKLMNINVYNTSNQLVLSRSDFIDFKTDTGDYEGTIDMGNSLPKGNFIVKISTPGYLWRKAGTVAVTPHQTMTIPQVTLVAGDFNNDNSINVLDWNILMGCYSDSAQPTFCNLDKTKLTDISADFHVDFLDVNLLLREFAIQHGD